MDDRIYKIALAMTPGLGCRSCRQLLGLYPDPKRIFEMSHAELKQVFGGHEALIRHIEQKTMMARAEEELLWADRYGIRILFSTDADYPQRLNRAECADTPVTLYQKGECDLNAARVLSVVGTRRATEYGKDMTQRLLAQLQGEGVLIVSGLAYGIDASSHRASLQYGLPTVGVLGHGLDQIYPPENRTLAQEMVNHGGALLTEYPSKTRIQPGYFPARNRIIAALSDATIVVEASENGGALITAGIAGSYHRDVFAVPGRVFDAYSKGCNNLIANNRAVILRSMDDLFYHLNWTFHQEKQQPQIGIQQELFASMSQDEQKVYGILQKESGLSMEEIEPKCELSLPKIANALLNLELNNLVKCLPGKIYKCC